MAFKPFLCRSELERGPWLPYTKFNDGQYDTQKALFSKHLVGDPDGAYCIAAGGRCYTTNEVWSLHMQMCVCPICLKVCLNQKAYEDHHDAVH